jgi:hypothetical protein
MPYVLSANPWESNRGFSGGVGNARLGRETQET